MKRIYPKIFILLLVVFLALPLINLSAQTISEAPEIYFFYSAICPHCAKEEGFLNELEKKYSGIEIERYEITYYPENKKILGDLYEKYQVPKKDQGWVPVTFTPNKYFVGFNEQIAKEIESCLQECLGEVKTTSREIKIPFLGQRDLMEYSLPTLAIIVGLLDGFNPCAMWVLIFLISLLFGIVSVRRRWLIGSIFILASGIVYFMFMTAWLQAFLFLSYYNFIRWGIGIFAIVFGAYNFRDYWRARKDGLVCKVTSSEKRKKIFNRLKVLVQEKNLLLALAGIVALAFAVNLVELACSAGFPAIFTSILALNDLPYWQYYLYILIYIFFFMLDDLIVFAAAMVTLQATNLGTKYVKYSKLIGGLVILTLGLLLIFRPGWLMFG